MKRIFYVNGSIVTGDRTADAILAYAEALAQKESSDTIEVPILLAADATARAQLLIGPASQLLSVPEVSDRPEHDDDDVIAALEASTRSVLEPQGQAIPAQDSQLDPDIYDLGDDLRG